MLPLLDALLVQLISVLVAGAGFLLFVQLLLNALPLLHEGRHFDFSLLRLQRKKGRDYLNHTAINGSSQPGPPPTLSFFTFLVLSVGSVLGGAGSEGGWGGGCGG